MVQKIKKKLSKIDKFVKTFEAWWAFGACVIAITAMMTTAVMWATPKLMAIGWPYWVLVGFPMTFVVGLAVRYFTWWWVKYKTPTLEVTKTLNMPNIDGDAPKLIENQSVSDNDLAKKVQQIDGQLGRLTKLSSVESKQVSIDLQSQKDAIIDEIKGLESNLSDKFYSLLDNQKKENAIRFGELAEILEAKTYLYRYDNITSDILALAKKLDKLPMVDNWESLFIGYKGKLKTWDTFKDTFNVAGYQPIFNVEPEMLKSNNWTDEISKISDDDLALSYKHFRIYNGAFEKNRQKIGNRILDIAYQAFGQGTTRISFFEKFM